MQVIRFIVGISLLSAMYTHIAHSEDQDPWWQSHTKVYEPDIVFPKIDLEIQVVENADTECKKYADDIKYKVEHCAVQYTPYEDGHRKCVLIMQRDKLTMGDLGHELRHCFEGDWHAYRPTKRIKR
jgi:hypothetical protein